MDTTRLSEIIDTITAISNSMDKNYPRECEESLRNIWAWSQTLSGLVEKSMKNHPKFRKTTMEANNSEDLVLMIIDDIKKRMDKIKLSKTDSDVREGLQSLALLLKRGISVLEIFERLEQNR